MSSLLRTALLRPALEEISDGKANKEIEHTFYARVVDLEELKKAASVEKQEQWEIRIPRTERNGVQGSIRIRKTTLNEGEPEYVMTTKTKAGDKGEKVEVPIPTTAANFVQFQFLSENGMVKDRYSFPVEGTDLVWEVDMYKKPDGTYFEWAKIDLEVKDWQVAIPPLPIKMEGLITAPYGKRTPEEEAFVTALFNEHFITKSPYAVPAVPA